MRITTICDKFCFPTLSGYRKCYTFQNWFGGGSVFRNSASKLLVILLVLLFCPTNAYAQDITATWPQFGGIWETTEGKMALWQAEDKVWGIYTGSSEIGGYIREDGKLHFWYERGSDDMGMGWLEISEDGRAFEGFYTSSLDPGEHDSWGGTWIGPNNFAIGDVAALDYVPGDTLTADADDTDTPDDQADTVLASDLEDAVDSGMTIDTDSAWGGTWDTERGFLVLAVSEGWVFGSFGEDGVIEGTAENATLSASWSVTRDDGTLLEGEALFTLSEDSINFRGTYNSTDDPNLWLPWMGSKIITVTVDEDSTDEADTEEEQPEGSEPE